MIRRIVALATAAAVIAAAAATAVVAASFAIYALLREPLGAAGAAAIVSALFALVALVGGLILMRKPPQVAEQQDDSMLGRVMDIARDRPVVAAGAALAAALIAWRNPKIIAAGLSAFIAGRTTQK